MVGKKILAIIIVASIVSASAIYYFYQEKGGFDEVVFPDEITALQGLHTCMNCYNFTSDKYALKGIYQGNTTPNFDGLSDEWRYTFWEIDENSGGFLFSTVHVYSDGTCKKVYAQGGIGWIPSELYGIPPRTIFLDSDEVGSLLYERIQIYTSPSNVTDVKLQVWESVYYQNGNPIAYPIWRATVKTENGTSYGFNIDAEDGHITQGDRIPSTDPNNFYKATNTKIVEPANNTNVSGVINITSHISVCYCSNPTYIFVDGNPYGAGTLNGTTGEELTGLEYEIYHYEIDTTIFENGLHRIVVLGKHTQYGDEVYLNFTN
ncbi:MAG: hypothetical protein KAR56_02960 [Thermoplasmata archaeon]|nr:hypothetical protein [Thermoplasmata archaeon]